MESPGDDVLSAAVAVAPETIMDADHADDVVETQEDVLDQEVPQERASWSSEDHQKPEDEDDWMVTPLETLEARQQALEGKQDEHEDIQNVEASVREALRFLEDSDGPEEDTDEDLWTERQDGYLDFVQEVMEAKWTEEDREDWTQNDRDRVHSEEEQIEEEDDTQKDNQETEHKQEDKPEDAQEQKPEEKTKEDEWQEAYTAKGRVYYYNRRTRESSWKKPSHYNLSASEVPVATKEEEKTGSSVLRQSLGYHPSASASAVSTMERQTTLFCNFCGEQQPSDRLAAHFHECATVKLHKRRMTPLYASFERALGLLSEDATLRSLHYVSSFPDPTPHGRPDAVTVQDSLLLLRPKRRHSKSRSAVAPSKQIARDWVIEEAEEVENRSPDRRHEVDRVPTRRSSDHKWKKKSPGKRKSPKAANSALGAPVPQYMETCRYCNRSFAEGRLAKHESVCLRVFGNEGSWGRGSPTVRSPSRANAKITRAEPSPESAGSASKLHKLKEHTLQQSYKEHQATLVICPCCRRKFAPSGAQQHIAICKGVQNRPKNPIPLLRDYAIAG